MLHLIFVTLSGAMHREQDDLSVYADVEIPATMRGDPLKNPALFEIDCPPGPARKAASQTYKLIEGLYEASYEQHFLIHPDVVLRAYDLVRESQENDARKFTLLHVLLRGIYAQLWLESNEDYGARYQTIEGANALIDQTIQWMHQSGISR